MHLPTTTIILTLSTLTITAATPNLLPEKLSKRCSPARDPDLALGYYPPAPCWQTFDPACQPHLAPNTEMTLDAKHGLAVVYGVSESCVGEIEEELKREKEGRKNYGWVGKHGWLTVLEKHGGDKDREGRTLVISGMGREAVERYAALGYLEFPTGKPPVKGE